MNLSPLTVLNPLDGRYAAQTKALRLLFSEYGLMKMRIKVELEWLKMLSHEPSIEEIAPFSETTLQDIGALIDDFSVEHAEAIKAIELRTQHDVKAIEYWLKERLVGQPERAAGEFIHFSCTSEDINNLAYALMLKTARNTILLPLLDQLLECLTRQAHEYAALPMMCRTHGQAATPSTLGKEFANVVYRLRRQRNALMKQEILGKMNGAVGNYNAHLIAYPDIDWESLCGRFVASLGLSFNPYTTQIEPHDYMAELFHTLVRINTILMDLNRDLWGYIALGYFSQKVKAHEVGSSTMPHKVNPIDFENSEGNLGLANAMLSHLAEKLPISRWQRDLSDSTVLRNMGVALGYSLLGFAACLRGLNKLVAQPTVLAADLASSWMLLAEPIQTVMRRYGIANPYEQLKTLTRGKEKVSQETVAAFIKSLDIPAAAKEQLLSLSPAQYLGKAEELARGV